MTGNEEGGAEVAREYGLAHMPDVKRTEFGIPRIDDMVAITEARTEDRLMCFADAVIT